MMTSQVTPMPLDRSDRLRKGVLFGAAIAFVVSAVVGAVLPGSDAPRGLPGMEAAPFSGGEAASDANMPVTPQGSSAEAIADSARGAIERAFITGDSERLAGARRLLERALVAFPDDPMLIHYLGFAHYCTATMLSEADAERSKAHLDSARAQLERARELHDLPETWAVLSAVYGMSIGSNPISGMTLGPKANRAIDRALELGPGNPRVWLIHGISALYTPPAFGGGLDKALARFEKARQLFETDAPRPPDPAWGKAEVHVWLGIAQLQKGDRAAAERAFRRALEIEPDFAWVKEGLLPQLAEPRSGLPQ